MIVTILGRVVALMTANDITAGQYTFGLGTRSYFNAIGEQTKFPIVALLTPIANTIKLNQSGFKQRTYPVKLFILFKSELNWTPLEHDQKAIQKARLAVNNLINILEDDELVEKVDQTANELEFINVFDINASGILLDLKITTRNTNSICT